MINGNYGNYAIGTLYNYQQLFNYIYNHIDHIKLYMINLIEY